MTVDAVLFDFDGTLAHTEPAYRRAYREMMFRFAGVEVDEREVARFINMTASEFAALFPSPDLLARFDLMDRAPESVRTFSRGMKQRLAIARALVHGPRLLLMDEPFTGLDEPGSQTLVAALRDFVRGGGAVVMSTHDLERAFDVATRALILDSGSVTLDRSVAAHIVRLDPAQEDGFERTFEMRSDFGPGRHIGYAVQWFALGLTMLVVYVLLSLKPKSTDAHADSV